MPEPNRRETQMGLVDLTKRLSARGIEILETRRKDTHSAYFVIGSPQYQTDITISDEFLDDLPGTKDYHAIVDSYAQAVAGRLKCGNPEVFYCRSGVAVQIAIRWPIQSAVVNGTFRSDVLIEVRNVQDEQFALCSINLGFGFREKVFEIVLLTANSVRKAIDDGAVSFYPAQVHQEFYQQLPRREEPSACSQSELVEFLAGKAFTLGFMAVDHLSEIWAVDPWDAKYLGVSTKELSLAMRTLQAKRLLRPGPNADYPLPTDELLAQKSSEKDVDESGFQVQQVVSLTKLPNKDEFLKDIKQVLGRHSVSAVIVIDLDNFKSVNDANGHLAGDRCLHKVVVAIALVVGRRGKLYRWGGDEFVVCLPDFSTEEAKVTAERIRLAVESAKPGGEIPVSTSIGVCGTDRVESGAAQDILDFADKAMYESKRSGKNRVTTVNLRS